VRREVKVEVEVKEKMHDTRHKAHLKRSSSVFKSLSISYSVI
jgi:hypothetical protein